MPEEKQKLWTKLVKRQSRTTWAVLGVALVALLLAVWWVPAIASVPQIISFSPDEDEGPEEQSGNPGYITIESDTINENIQDDFLIMATCGSDFQVKAIYATVVDPEGVITVSYISVYVAETEDDDPSIIWGLDFKLGGFSQAPGGVELLSMLQIEKPVGLEADMTLIIGGTVTWPETATNIESNDELTVTAVFESVDGCTVKIVTEEVSGD